MILSPADVRGGSEPSSALRILEELARARADGAEAAAVLVLEFEAQVAL